MVRRSGHIGNRIFLMLAGWRPYVAAVMAVAIGVGAAFLLQRLPLANLSLVFLSVVIITAARWGLGPSMVASLLSFLAFNYLFTRPYYTLRIEDGDDVATLLVFLLVSAVAGNLAARMRSEMADRQAALERISTLYDFSRTATASVGARDVMQRLCEHLHALVNHPVAAYLSVGDDPCRVAAAGAVRVHAAEINEAWHAIDRVLALGDHRYVKVMTSRGIIGIVAVETDSSEPNNDDMIIALCDQAAVAVERTMLVGDLERERVKYETEKLRTALLTSVSHDLRTPLASIVGSTSSLIEYGDAFSADSRHQLQQSVLDEAKRLDRYIQNLLDMTRLEHGGFTLRRDWVDLNDLTAAAVQRLGILANVGVNVDIAEDARLLFVHGAFLEQTLFNLLDNAVRFSPPGGVIMIKGYQEGQRLNIDVVDQGPGIPAEERKRVFELFYSAARGDSGSSGTGLGLAICRGMVGAHGGSIEACPGPDGAGTRMHISLPYTSPRYDESLVS